ncbi:ABC transporter permease [Cellulomonas sp. PhB143]|uniref:ABC transporter permease n=1 Tax=Cellulomonas sp. PhB143 TaxID=2485186 RepID=UPI000F4A8F49|nr:polyketide antibiotic transporter [Cellulomonas sp. PhB143]ROS78931.1 ABC-2 type transport system permease protein [Cellulomonas sp. PhB143]
MTTAVGTGLLTRFALRRDRLRIPVWALSLSLLFLYAVTALNAVYPTAADRQVRADLVSSPAAVMMTGPGYGTDDYTLGAMVANEFTLWVVLAAAVMNIVLVVRHTRAEEESGRAELLRAGVVGRRAPGLAALLDAAVANLAVGLACFVLILAGASTVDGSGITVADTAALCLGIALTGMVFAAVASVTSQISEHARTASGAALAVLGVAYLLQAAGDVHVEHGSWVSWLSPVAWTQQTRPYVDLRWWPLALAVALFAALMLLAVRLTARRDLGAGLLPARAGRAQARPGLRGPFALAWRQQWTSVVAWGAGVAVLALASGTFADETGDLEAMVEDNDVAAQVFGGGDLSDAFAAVMVLFMVLGIGGWAVSSVLRARAEEASGRLEPVLAASVSRGRWLGAQLAVTAVGTVVLLVVSGLALGLGEKIGGIDDAVVGRLVLAHLAYVPAIAVLAGVAVALQGALGRFAGLAWALLAYAFVVGLFGALLDLPGWALDLSPYENVPTVADADPDATPLAVLAVVALVLVTAGFAGFRRRDLAA